MSRRNNLVLNTLSFAVLAICLCLANDGGFASPASVRDSRRHAPSRLRVEAARHSADHAPERLVPPAIRFLPPASTRLNYLVSYN